MPRMEFDLRWLMIGVAVLCSVFAIFGWHYRQEVEPRQLDNVISKKIQSLTLRRPSEVSPRQWESAVAWTMNLHRYSFLRVHANSGTMRQFHSRLADNLADHVNLDTIDWIWDEYSAMSPSGARYKRQFKSQMVNEIQAGGANWGLTVP